MRSEEDSGVVLTSGAALTSTPLSSNSTAYQSSLSAGLVQSDERHQDPICQQCDKEATIPPGRKQLLFLYDCTTTGGSHYEDHIIEIASAVILPDNLSVTKTEFSSLCHTSRQINLHASLEHGIITPEMLVDQPSFSIVFNRLLEWIKQCTKEACSNNNLYYPVLVAHNGFPFHYYFLMAEIKHHNLEHSLKKAELWFADTLHDARRLLKASHPIFNNWSQQEPKRLGPGLGLVDLFHNFFPEESFGAIFSRRAMEDIQAMKQVFTTTTLTPILKNLTIKTKEEIWKKWYEKWYARHISQLDEMGHYCSECLPMCLNKEITYDQLKAAAVAYSPEEYDKWMKGKGIWLKKCRDNIQNHFSDLPNYS